MCALGQEESCWAAIEEDIVWYDHGGNMWSISAKLGNRWSAQSMTWNDAISYCNNLNYAGKSDWRLPTWQQLRNDFGVSACGWGYASDFFSADQKEQSACRHGWDSTSYDNLSPYYWSSSEFSDIDAWTVSFNNGYIYKNKNLYNFSAFVRCRRGN